MNLEIPEDALSIVILVGKEKKHNIDNMKTYFQEERHYSETESEYSKRLSLIRNSKQEITKISKDQSGKEQIDNLQFVIEVSKDVWDDDEYRPEKLYKDELLPEKVLFNSELVKEFMDSYEMQHLSYGWVETGRAAVFAKLSTDDLSIKRRSLWLDNNACSYEISKRRQFVGPVLDGWRKESIERLYKEKVDEQAYIDKYKNLETVNQESGKNKFAVVSSPMKRTSGGMTYSYPVQIMAVTKTKPPLAPRGRTGGFSR